MTEEEAIKKLQSFVANPEIGYKAMKNMFELYRNPKYLGLSIEEAYLKCLDKIIEKANYNC